MSVSRNPYSRQSIDLVKKYENGLILDDGAGYPLEEFHFPNVIQMEIVPYPTTDVIGDGRKLPFKDGSFDAVLSHAVLEHVPDPFAYVSEIFRVLKPGGEVYCDSAFLQPVHAYPSHFFNTTLMALDMLFKDFDRSALGVEPHQMPWVTLRWILRSYANGFTEEHHRERFMRLSVEDILSELENMNNVDFYNNLKPDSIVELACGVNFQGHKPIIGGINCKNRAISSSLLRRFIQCRKDNGTLYTIKKIFEYLGMRDL